jgi:hypothetical protein
MKIVVEVCIKREEEEEKKKTKRYNKIKIIIVYY